MRAAARRPFRLLTLATFLGAALGAGCGADTPADGTGAGGSPNGTGGARSGTGGAVATGGQTSSGGVPGGPSGGQAGGQAGGQSGGRSGTGGAITSGSGGNAGAAGGGGGSRASGGATGAGGARPDGGTVTGGGGARTDGGPPPSAKITVWLAGDSTMQPCTTSCPCGWGSQFQPLFNSDVTVKNLGSGGRSIQTWLYESNVTSTLSNGECVVNPKTFSPHWQSVLDGIKAGDYLFVEFGINDTDSTCPRHVGTSLFQSDLQMMADAATQRGAHPILLTSTDAIICSGGTATLDRAFGPQTRAAATASGAAFIDLTQLTADLYTQLEFCPNDGNYTSTTSALGKFFCADHTHFEAAGAAQIASVVAKALRDQNIPLAAYLR
ncbi:MAG TPA: carbohydrate esterase [Polyangia bacterium]|nr:carbohydrate esterase [Polyangia bacterium]